MRRSVTRLLAHIYSHKKRLYSSVFKLVAQCSRPMRIGDYLESLKGQEGLKDVKLLFINRSVAIDGVKATALRRVRSGQIIEIEKTTESKPALSSSPASKHVVDLRKLVSFVYEDEHMAVLYKPPGLITHPNDEEGEDGHSVVSVLVDRYGRDGLSAGEHLLRPGIVHRLDRDTAGLLVVCRTNEAHDHLKRQFQARTVRKIYAGIVQGRMEPRTGRIDLPIARHRTDRRRMTCVREGGREALTAYRTAREWHVPGADGGSRYALLRVRLHTGRTHQIRVHLAAVSHPLIGDPLYLRRAHQPTVIDSPLPLCLCAIRLAFDHPSSGERVEFTCDLPPHMNELITALNDYIVAEDESQYDL